MKHLIANSSDNPSDDNIGNSTIEISFSIQDGIERFNTEQHVMALFRTFFQGEMTGFEITCLKSFITAGHHVVVYSYDPLTIPKGYFEIANASTVLPREKLFTYKTGIKAGSFSGFSNLFRYSLCEMFEDWWIDTDVVCLKSNWPEESRFVAGWERGDSVNCAVLRLDRISAGKLKEQALTRGENITWGETGPRLLTKFIFDEKKEALVLPQSAFYAIPYPQWQEFYQEEHCQEIWERTRQSLAVHLWHSLGQQNSYKKEIAPAPNSFFGQLIQREETGHLFETRRRWIATGVTLAKSESDRFEQPLVSVIVSNYNYAHYLKRCLHSVFQQTYPKIECIVIDDASTDESVSVLGDLAARNLGLTIHKRSVNGGQSAAILDGLERASGQFVVMLDADDMLLPNAIASHVYVHQGLRDAVGFTCADMLQIDGNTLMSAASPGLNQFVINRAKNKYQERHTSLEIILRPDDVRGDILDNLYLVDSGYKKGWAWSATSGMMFRRDALRLWERTPGLANLRYSTDAFFCYGINAICGSIVIDVPLAAYRIHGKNGFAARLPLKGIRGYDLGSPGERSMDALRLLLREAKANKAYRRLFWRRHEYKVMLSYLRLCLNNLRRNNAAGWF